MRGKPWEIVKEHLMVHVRLTPNARKNGIGGIYTGADGAPALGLYVSVPPEKGKANKAAIAILSKALKAPKSAISVAIGETSRTKVFKISPPFDHALERLEDIVRKYEDRDGEQ